MQWGMVNVNEMDNDLLNEWDGNESRNEWVGLWYIQWMRWKWLSKYVTDLAWNAVVISQLVVPITTWICWDSCESGYGYTGLVVETGINMFG